MRRTWHESRVTAAFTLIEIAMVLVVLSLLTAMALRYSTVTADSKNTKQLNETLDVVETALQNYRNAYGRMPCPADISFAEGMTNFGVEYNGAGKVGVSSGCYGSGGSSAYYSLSVLASPPINIVGGGYSYKNTKD